MTALLPKKREAVVRAIKNILDDDKDMLPSTIVGYVGFEKEAILRSNTFEESALMASVLKYAMSCDNVALKSSIKEIPKDYSLKIDGYEVDVDWNNLLNTKEYPIFV